MSEDLLRQLRLLEDDYARQPLIAQRADLREINHIRSQLGMTLVDARLNEIGVAAVEVEAKPEPKKAKPNPEGAQDHTEARAIYQTYLKKIKELEMHRAYAEQVAEATAGPGQTPVRPLATMGTNGGPLLCDHCGKPIALEGGRFHGVGADAAWKENPREDWTSWILGGIVVELLTNGTLRVYHGYPGRSNDCCEVALRQRQDDRAKFEAAQAPRKDDLIHAFLEHEFPDMTTDERLDLLGKLVDTLYSYDPGVGMNRPSERG